MDTRWAIGYTYGRRALAAALALLSMMDPGGVAARAGVLDPAAIKTLPSEAKPEDFAVVKPDYQADTTPDQIGRIVVPVMVNGQGPFLFALDTGANRTVVTPQLLTALGLVSTSDDSVTMEGATGSAVVPTAIIARIAAGDVVLENQALPVAQALAAGISGIFGADALENKHVEIDFKTGKIEIRNAHHLRPVEGAVRIPAQMQFGLLMVVDAVVDRIHVKAVIDTGSEYTLGNAALRAALIERAHSKRPKEPIDVLGETLVLQHGDLQPVTTLTVGDVRADHFNIVFGEFYVFRLWGLDTRPALVIGMDLISKLDTFAIDYQRREVQLLPRVRPDVYR
jgi:predicted aspartyl protease